MKVKKIIIPIAGLATRFLPLSKSLPKELWPLIDKPVLMYILEEVFSAGLREVIFISTPQKKEFWDHFRKKNKTLRKILLARGKEDIFKELELFENFLSKIKFSEVFQDFPLGDGHAILQARKKIKKEGVAVAFADDVYLARKPAILQLIEIFKKYQKPVMGLFRVPWPNVPFYGSVQAKKIGKRTYLIEKIIEKPKIKEAPSNLVSSGRHVLVPEVFDYLEKAKKNKKGEIVLAEVLEKMIEDGKKVIGYEIEGKWLECGNKLNYLKSQIYLSLKDPRFKKELRVYLKKILR
ncbi:MAG: UTP--glucose-1-phosphate uridylyltransferase [Minisyncoccales bacterium]